MEKRCLTLLLVLGMIVAMLSGCAGVNSEVSEVPELPTKETTAEPIEEKPVRDEASTGQLEFRIYGEDGNAEIYSLENVEPLEENVLTGRTIYWLGSSVTFGAASKKTSMVEYIAARNNCICVKEAVSGTTFFTTEDKKSRGRSYVSRMISKNRAFDKDAKIDAFICQISTNDAKSENLIHYGEMPTDYSNTDLNSFDLSTTIGSVQYIIEYVKETWDCPVYFYSGSYFGDENTRGNRDPSGSDYAKLVNDVKTIAENWNAKEGYTVKVIDMYNDTDFNALITDTDYNYLMNDAIHPSKAGYLVWWTPYFENFLYQEFGGGATN